MTCACIIRYNAGVRLGVMGGTFDPIHNGHLFIAEAARVQVQLNRVLWLPNRQPAHREGKIANAEAETRAKLVELAIADHRDFQLSRVELDRAGPSYAIETLAQLKLEYSDSEIYWILGADAIGDLPTWHRADELMATCRFIAFNRPGFDLQTAKNQLSSQQQARVTWLQVPGIDIASRQLRERVQRNLPIRYLLPEPVRQEIERQNLYRN